MKDYNNKLVEFQPVSANDGAGYLIRNGRTKEEVYLKSVSRERMREIMAEYEFHLPKGRKPRKKKQKPEEGTQEYGATATWTEDETAAMHFETMREAQQLIDKWSILRMAGATIVKE